MRIFFAPFNTKEANKRATQPEERSQSIRAQAKMRLAALLFVCTCALISGARSMNSRRVDDIFEIERPHNGRGNATRGRAGRQFNGQNQRQQQERNRNGYGRGGGQPLNNFPYQLGRQGPNQGRRQSPRQQPQRGLNQPQPNYPQQKGGPGQGQNGQGNPNQQPQQQNQRPYQPPQQNQRPNQPRQQPPLPRGNGYQPQNGPSPKPNAPGQPQGPPEPNDYDAYDDDGQGQPANNGQGPGSEVPNLPTENQDGPPGDQEMQGPPGGDPLQV